MKRNVTPPTPRASSAGAQKGVSMVTISEIRREFPDPVPVNHECASHTDDDAQCTHYCVLGAVMTSLTGDTVRFPGASDVLSALGVGADSPLFAPILALEAATIDHNDAGRFEYAWQCADAILILLREHALV